MKKWIVLTFVIMGGAVVYVQKNPPALTQKDFILSTLDVGSIEQKVTATGTLEPLTPSASAQVSGMVEDIFMDYNDEVIENQLLALLDDDLLRNKMMPLHN